MEADFKNAFDRHREDADLLWNNERWANADHHYGVAAECALKALLITQGIQSQDGDIGNQQKKFRVHIDELWTRYHAFMQTKNAYPLPETNPFKDWYIGQRYSNDKDITRAVTEPHRNAVNDTIYNIVKKAKLDGVW